MIRTIPVAPGSPAPKMAFDFPSNICHRVRKKRVVNMSRLPRRDEWRLISNIANDIPDHTSMDANNRIDADQLPIPTLLQLIMHQMGCFRSENNHPSMKMGKVHDTQRNSHDFCVGAHALQTSRRLHDTTFLLDGPMLDPFDFWVAD